MAEGDVKQEELAKEKAAEEKQFVDEFVSLAGGDAETIADDDAVTEEAKAAKAAEEAKAAEAAKAAKATDVDYKKLYDEQLQRTRSWEGRIKKTEQEKALIEEKLKEVTDKVNQDTSISLEELLEDPDIKGFAEEMGADFIKPLFLLMKKVATKTASDTVKPIAEGDVRQIKEKLTADEEGKVIEHYSKIYDAHPDALQLLESGEVNEYVDTLPHKEALEKKRILANGSTQEVIDVLTEFKEKSKAVVEAKAKATEEAKRDALKKKNEEETRRKLSQARVVKSTGNAVTPGKEQAQDFAGAFAEAVNES